MQDEMSAHVETALKADLWLDEHDGKRALVDAERALAARRTLPASCGLKQSTMMASKRWRVMLANDFVRSGEMLDADLEVVKDPTQDADGFIVRTPQ